MTDVGRKKLSDFEKFIELERANVSNMLLLDAYNNCVAAFELYKSHGTEAGQATEIRLRTGGRKRRSVRNRLSVVK